MVNWRNWEVIDLFKDAENLPAFLGMSLPELSIEDRLHFYELLHPIHRLLDFWCGHPMMNESMIPVSDWTDTDWQTTQVHLHPQLKTSKAKEDLIECVKTQKPFEISQYVKLPTIVPITLESRRAACLLPLWETEQPMISLVERWQQIQPVDPVTLDSINPQIAFEQVKELLTTLDAFLYVLLERSGSN